jgi:tetratricopeptide (TPR) repeat protein
VTETDPDPRPAGTTVARRITAGIAVLAIVGVGVGWWFTAGPQDVPGPTTSHRPVQLRELLTDARAAGDIPRWIRAAEGLTEEEPENPRWWWTLTEAWGAESRDVEVVYVLERALEHKLPEQEKILMRHQLIERLILLGDAQAARRELEIVERHPRVSPERVHVHRARLLRLEGYPREALAELQLGLDAMRSIPPEAIRLRSRLHLDLGNLVEAERDLVRVARQLSNDEVTHFMLSDVYHKLGRQPEAKRHRRIYLEIKAGQSAPPPRRRAGEHGSR